MKIIDIIVEAPIEDIHTYGDFSQDGSFRPGDRTLIRSPKGQDQIKRVLFNIPVPVVLHMVNHSDQIRGLDQARVHLSRNSPDRYTAKQPQRVGLITPEMIQQSYGVQLQVDPKSFNLVVVENEGASRYPLTPWIIAHRMKHAFDFMNMSGVDSNKNDFAVPMKVRQIEYEFLRMIGGHTGLFGYPKEQEEPLRLLLSSMLDTKSGRDGTLITAGEFMPEAFALYCVKGRIGLKPVAGQVALNAELPKWEQALTQGWRDLLQWGIGKIVAL